MSLERAESQIKRAGWLGIVLAGWAAVVIVIALNGQGGDRLTHLASPWGFVDVLIYFGLSVGVLRRSRWAAVLLFGFYAWARIYVSLESGRPGSLIVTLVILWVFGKGISATFAHYRLSSPPARARSWGRIFVYVVGGGVCLLVCVILGLGLLVELGSVPDPEVVPGSALRASTLETLRSHDLLGEDETIVYFYSGGFLSFLADGNFFTESRVVSYHTLEGELYEAAATFEEISGIGLDLAESWIEVSRITISLDNGEEFELLVSGEEELDQAFYKALVETWREKRTGLEIPLERSLESTEP